MRGLIAIGVLGATCIASSANAQSYTLATTTATFQTIENTGTAITFANADDGSSAITVPFAFELHGTAYASGFSIGVNTNGMLDFSGGSTEYTNVAIPSSTAPNAFVAPLWTDLTMESGTVYWQVQGSAGSRTLVVEWNFAKAYMAAAGDFLTFQAQLEEGTNLVRFAYGQRATSTDVSASIGVEDTAGQAGFAVPCTPTCVLVDIPPNMLHTLTPSGVVPMPNPDLIIDRADTVAGTFSPGDTVTVGYQVSNVGPGDSPSTTLAVAYDEDPKFQSPTILDEFSVPGLVPQGFDAGSFVVTMPNETGTIYFAAVVDPFNSIIEVDELNNSVVLGSADLVPPTTVTITTASLPAGVVGVPYSFQMEQAGGDEPVWSISVGALPAGLSMSQTGLISGTPTVEGNEEFVIFVQSGASSDDGLFSLPVASGLTITTTSLPDGRVGVPYAGLIEAVGATGSLEYGLTSGPGWMIVDNDTGAVRGTPTEDGTFTVEVFAADEQGVAQVSLSVIIEPALPLSLASSLPVAGTSLPYTAPYVAGGIPPFETTLVSGGLPPGIEFDASGLLSGACDTAGEYTFELSVRDSGPVPAEVQGSLTLVVSDDGGFRITTRPPITVFTNQDTDVPLLADGGTEPYTWSLAAGTLMEGITIDPSGRVIGRAATSTTVTVTIAATDALGLVATLETEVRSTVYSPPTDRGGRRGGGCGCHSTQMAPSIPLQNGAALEEGEGPSGSPARSVPVLIGFAVIGLLRRRLQRSKRRAT